MGSSRAATSLAAGLGISVAMWSVAFLGRLPGIGVPGSVLLPALALPLVLGGAGAGRRGGAGAGALAGLVASLVNLLVLGSVLGSGGPDVSGAALAGVAATLPAGVLLGAAGGALGARRRTAAPADATSTLARVAVAATLVLVLVGGLVTSHDAGLAVVDWPNSFGSPMFLFPLARMVGGVFYEHAHRLFGSLVGLVTLVLAIRLLAAEPRRPVKAAGLAALALVIVQGVLGGLRVTGHFTWSDSPEVTRPSLGLAMVHGATGQVFFALLAALAAVTSRTWREAPPPAGDPASAATDRTLPWAVVGALLVQLALGLRLRHLGEGVMIHITFAIVVLILAAAAAVRATAKHEHVPPVRKAGAALLGHALAQVVLGGLAFLAVARARDAGPGAFDVVVATLHQTVGALLLANATLLALWSRRLLPTPAAPAPSPLAASGS